MSAVAPFSIYRRADRTPLLPTTDTVAAVAERVFVEQVGKHLHEGILRYSDRLVLLRAASRLHIERFRANLIIALVLRQSQTGRPKMRMAVDTTTTERRWKFASTLGIILLIEAITVAGLWWAFA
jgi:hypothetical protein